MRKKMKKSLLLLSIFPLVLLLCLNFSCEQQGEKVDVESDIAAIKELWKQYEAAEISGDIDLWISLWTDDGIRMPPNTPAVFGKERIRETVQSFFDRVVNGYYTIKFTVKSEEIRVTGDWAFARGTYTFSSSNTAGETIKRTGKLLSILERQADGSWKLTHQIYNTNN
jgi:uncharacterized protein (TIGR02246 family)